MALDGLQKKNPEAAQLIKGAIQSGKSPAEFAKEQAAKGNISEKSLNNLKQYYGIAKQMGLPSIPEKEWASIENAIKNKGGSPVNDNSNGFNGF